MGGSVRALKRERGGKLYGSVAGRDGGWEHLKPFRSSASRHSFSTGGLNVLIFIRIPSGFMV